MAEAAVKEKHQRRRKRVDRKVKQWKRVDYLVHLPVLLAGLAAVFFSFFFQRYPRNIRAVLLNAIDSSNSHGWLEAVNILIGCFIVASIAYRGREGLERISRREENTVMAQVS